jgi:hypothetical protein
MQFFCGLRELKIEKKARNEMHSIVFKRQVLLFSKNNTRSVKIINVQLKKMCFIDAKIFKKYDT